MKNWVSYSLVVASLLIGEVDGSFGDIYVIDKSPYATTIAHKLGDILTVNVSERATSKNNADEDLTRDSSHAFDLAKFFLPSFHHKEGFTQTIGTGTTPGVDFNSKSTMKNGAKNSASHDLITTIPVRIIEEVTEGQFYIRGHRLLNINGKEKKIFVSGVIRQEDITAANSIDSSKIVEAVVEIDGDIVDKELGPGVFTKLYNFIF